MSIRRPIPSSCLALAAVLVHAGCPAARTHRASTQRMQDAAPSPEVPRGFRTSGPVTPGRYRAHLQRVESGYPSMELFYREHTDLDLVLDLAADGTLTLTGDGTATYHGLRTGLGGGHLPDGAPGNETHDTSRAVRVQRVGCWHAAAGAIDARVGASPSFSCAGDGGAMQGRLRCVALDGAPVGLAGRTVLACRPPADAAWPPGLSNAGVMLDLPLAPPTTVITSLETAATWLVLGPGEGVDVRFEAHTWSLHDAPQLHVEARKGFGSTRHGP